MTKTTNEGNLTTFAFLWAITRDLNRRFPAGNDPYQIMTRLLEECGELAQQVNHFEYSGVKRQKQGEPDPAHMAKEIKDVIRATLQIALYYGIEAEVESTFVYSLAALEIDS
ncbi:MAG: MazG nucleotide pyrophosphohydrolase domain-containing protein [Caldilineaceae bacterium]